MPLERIIRVSGLSLTEADERRIQHQLDGLERRLVHHPEPRAVLVFAGHENQRRVQVDLRVELGPLGGHLISHQQAETADRAVRLAIADVERQLERQHAAQRGEPSFGVPSRRLPAELRPSPFTRPATVTPAEDEAAEKEGDDQRESA
jgi:ribosome-associated translation inhibitor RaiA